MKLLVGFQRFSRKLNCDRAIGRMHRSSEFRVKTKRLQKLANVEFFNYRARTRQLLALKRNFVEGL